MQVLSNLLRVQVAPKISSSCSRSSVITCVCEAHGNPCPTLEWRLSGHVLSNSTETSISEEMLESTGVKSVLTTRSLTDTDVLQCFSANIYGRASHQFQAVPPPQETRFHHPSVLLGVAVGASVMMIVGIVMFCYERRRKEKLSETSQDNISELSLTQITTALNNDGECVYTNNGLLSSTALSAPESLHYSTIDFTNAEPASGEIWGIASLTSEYATLRHRPAGATDAENNTLTSETEPRKQDMTAKIIDTSLPESEDEIYGNISHHYRQKEPLDLPWIPYIYCQKSKVVPKISSSCSRSSVIGCVCEAHGNPCPTLEWRLSGHSFSNSTETSISEEMLGSTGVKSVLTTRQSLTDMDVLQCFSANIHGSASQKFQTVPLPQDTGFHYPSVLLGAAVGVFVMMIVCIVVLCCERKRKEKSLEISQDQTSGLILTQTAVARDNDRRFVYTNKDILPFTIPGAPESLHYSSNDFRNTEPPSGEIWGNTSRTFSK
ncbi:myelin-associated glyco -like protein [Labeo rohita]|uniref:Myelin-associated glyco-like protein n=1 Tax=Labeo rohita TaxID=84645 RepID=A0A498MZB1_LABRO|nr:myelin-associated glyco -like protein [Labeo rohita]RXN27268.1 myelin-associated glyco -like protein [Labeo rohita]